MNILQTNKILDQDFKLDRPFDIENLPDGVRSEVALYKYQLITRQIITPNPNKRQEGFCVYVRANRSCY